MKVLIISTLLLLFISCSKEEIPTKFKDQIILNELKTSSDGVILNWTELDNELFSSYTVMRSEGKANELGQEITLTRILNSQQTTYTDTEVPFSPLVKYKIIGNLINKEPVMSNSKEIARKQIKTLDLHIDQVIPMFAKHNLFLISKSGTIIIYDYTSNTVVKTKIIDSKIGFCDIKNYQNNSELFVPREDGWIYIYDSNSLELKDRIDIGRASSCVVFNNNQLFVSTDAWTQQPLKVYDRSTGKIIEETGDFDQTRIRLIPGTNSQFIEVTLNIAPTDLDYYNFDNVGHIIEHKNDKYHGDFPLDANIFEFFPNHQKFITGREGAIYNVNLEYQSRLPEGYLHFSDFCFDTQNNIIYAGCSNEKSVHKYDMNNYSALGFIKSNTYPQFVFRDNNQLIIIGKSSEAPDALFITENINL